MISRGTQFTYKTKLQSAYGGWKNHYEGELSYPRQRLENEASTHPRGDAGHACQTQIGSLLHVILLPVVRVCFNQYRIMME